MQVGQNASLTKEGALVIPIEGGIIKHSQPYAYKEIEGEKIFINTRTKPFFPPIDGMEEVNALDSAGLLNLEELPEHLLILGGGYIGVECYV